ncbi:MAG TPA: S8 family serine peptidase, partial [Kofleriaceae bacterium]|nr:S8 family serine peptidase [Kofleriaceae bacterium]
SLGGVMLLPGSKGGAAAAWTAWVRVVQYVTNRGLTVVTAAGNSALSSNGPTATVPGDLPNVVNVSATGIRSAPEFPQEGAYDVLTEYSNRGASISIAAPGGDLGPPGTEFPFPAAYYLIMSTYVEPTAECAATASCEPLWAWAAGTSMAAPHVTGAAGLVADHDPSLSAHGVRAALLGAAQPIGAAQSFGHGMLDVAAAVGAP